MVLEGHSHKFLYLVNPYNYTRIIVPAFSDFSELPTALRMKLEFKNGKINYGIFEQVFFGAKTFSVSKFEVPLGYGKDFTYKGTIGLENSKAKKKILQQPGPSQIDKFNAKWGNKS